MESAKVVSRWIILCAIDRLGIGVAPVQSFKQRHLQPSRTERTRARQYSRNHPARLTRPSESRKRGRSDECRGIIHWVKSERPVRLLQSMGEVMAPQIDLPKGK